MVLATGDHLNGPLADVYGAQYRVARLVTLTDEVEAVVTAERPDIVVLSRYLPGHTPLAAVLPAVRKAVPSARVALMVGPLDAEARQLIGEGAQYGIYNVLVGEEFTPDALQALVDHDGQWADIAAYLPDSVAGAVPRLTITAPAATPKPAVPETVTKYAKVIGVVSGKGGVGKSTISANLLAAARELGAIGIDLDITKPDLLFHFTPENQVRLDLRDLLNTLNLPEGETALDRRDVGLITEWVDRLPEVLPGVTVIPGPSRDLALPTVTRSLVAELVRYATQKARLVVVDTAFDIADEATLDILYGADVLLVVTSPDHTAVYQTAWYLQQLEDLRIPRGKVRLVVTRANQKGLKSPKDVAQLLGVPLAFTLPYDPARYETARISRKPLALREGPKGPFTQFLKTVIADQDTQKPTKSRRGLFSRRRTRSTKEE